MLDIIGYLFCIVVIGFFSLLPIVAVWGYYDDKKRMKELKFEEKSKLSDNFMDERKQVLDLLSKRLFVGGISCTIAIHNEFDRIVSSSEVASLFRFAHFAGCHITYEQNNCEWQHDAEYLDSSVFKTDMYEASDMRDQKYMQKYKRYFDPPISKRDRVLKNVK